MLPRVKIIIIIIIIIIQDGRRPDGAIIIPWSRGKALVWDVTVPDTQQQS